MYLISFFDIFSSVPSIYSIVTLVMTSFFSCPIVNDAVPTTATCFSRSDRSSIFPPRPYINHPGSGGFFFYQISTEFVRLGIFTDVLKPSGPKGVCR